MYVIAGTNSEKLKRLNKENGLDTIIINYSAPESFESVIKDVVKKKNKLDIFINSAGVHTENVNFWTVDSNEFDRVMDINLKGVFLHVNLSENT